MAWTCEYCGQKRCECSPEARALAAQVEEMGEQTGEYEKINNKLDKIIELLGAKK